MSATVIAVMSAARSLFHRTRKSFDLANVAEVPQQKWSNHLLCCDHHKATGPKSIPTASSTNNASHPDALAGPPAASSATPAPQLPNAARPNPTVECNAKVAPRCIGAALAVVPDVRAPESAETVRP